VYPGMRALMGGEVSPEVMKPIITGGAHGDGDP
jgi:hypothetical protein